MSGGCPALTFRLRGQTVYTSEATGFKRGSCKDVVNGRFVIVEGRKMSDGRVRGDTVQLGDAPPPTGERVELEGRVDSLAGTCPAITFRLRGVDVFTTGDTRFSDGRCQNLKDGESVDVKGRRQPDGRVFALEVEIDD
jgi:Domain of unknown function (DUF5666)